MNCSGYLKQQRKLKLFLLAFLLLLFCCPWFDVHVDRYFIQIQPIQHHAGFIL